METKPVEIAKIEWAKVAREERTFDKEFVAKLALSILTEGLHQPIVIRPHPTKPGHYIGVIGRHRHAAHVHLKRDVIDARIAIDMDQDEADIARISENLFHNPLNKHQTAAAVAKWYDNYDRRRKDFEAKAAATKAAEKRPPGRPPLALVETPASQVQSGPETGDSTEGTPPARVAVPTPEPLPPEPPKNFAKHVAEATGQSETTVKRSLKVGRAFDADQLEVFRQCGVGQSWMETIADLEKSKRDGVVNLIASGAEPQEAIARVNEVTEVKRADGRTFEVSPSDSGEDEGSMSDDEWVRFHCSETVALLADTATFFLHAALYRRTKDLRQAFKSKSKSAMAGARQAGLFGGFFSIIDRVVGVAHPKHWLRCGGCSGSGKNNGVKCKECSGNGFQVKIEGK